MRDLITVREPRSCDMGQMRSWAERLFEHARLTATSHSYGNGQDSTPQKSQFPQPIAIKLCTID